MRKEIVYIGDPMCSWCWGFAPVLGQIRSRFDREFGFRLIVGGLRPGNTVPMTDDLRHYIKHHWQQVNAHTGQPFSCDLLESDAFIYDSEPACRAVVTLRELQPTAIFDFFETLHRAFYVQSRDITQMRVLSEEAENFKVAKSDFEQRFQSREMKEKTRMDFTKAQAWEVTGFPSLLLREGPRMRLVAKGYVDSEAAASLLKELASS